jgi:hypothetical protein
LSGQLHPQFNLMELLEDLFFICIGHAGA